MSEISAVHSANGHSRTAAIFSLKNVLDMTHNSLIIASCGVFFFSGVQEPRPRALRVSGGRPAPPQALRLVRVIPHPRPL